MNVNFDKLSSILAYCQQYHLAKHKYAYRIPILAYFDKYDLPDIKRAHVKEWALMRQTQVSNSTVNREISFARSAINRVAIDFEVVLNNPFSNVKYLENDVIPNYLNEEEYHALLQSALHFENYDLYDFIVLLVMTGCRQAEVLTLTWDNVFLSKRHFVVRNTLSKSKRTMYKYLNNTAFEVLQRRQANKQGDYVFTNPRTGKNIKSFNKGWQLCKKRANVNCRMHDLRHTYASWLVQKGVPIYMIKELLAQVVFVGFFQPHTLQYSLDNLVIARRSIQCHANAREFPAINVNNARPID